jgi:hypothetical protein
MTNKMINTSKVCQTELEQFSAWCKACGAKGIYGDMYHCLKQDIIYNNTESCYSQIPQNEEENREMREFKVTGFHHVTVAGMMEFWRLLEENGTVCLLWDMKPNAKVNALMQSENFDLDAHIKTNYVGHDYDEILLELHDEMIDAITALEFAFTTNQTTIHFNGRSIENLDCVPSADVWSPNIYLPLTVMKTFQTITELGQYCCNSLCEGSKTIQATVGVNACNNTDGEPTVPQSITYNINCAADFKVLESIVDIWEAEGFYEFTFSAK